MLIPHNPAFEPILGDDATIQLVTFAPRTGC